MKEPEARINFHIPIRLRITGELTDDQLELLGETLARTLQTRLALAERTLRTRYGLSAAGADLDVREVYDAARESEDEGSYLIPSYDTHGQMVGTTLRAPGRAWIILKAINFHAAVMDFLLLVEQWQGADSVLEDKDLYQDEADQLRWVALWLVKVNEEYDISDLSQALSKRADELNKVGPKQVSYWAWSITDEGRQQIIDIDMDNRVAKEIPRLDAHNASRIGGVGTDVQVRPGGWVLFATMVLPRKQLQDFGTVGSEVRVSVKLRDLSFLVRSDQFEQANYLSWKDYVAEWGDQEVTVRLLPVAVTKKVHQLTLDLLMERQALATLQSERGSLTVWDDYSGHLFVLNGETLQRFPPTVRTQADALTDDTTRRLSDAEVGDHVAPGMKAAYIYTVFTADEESLNAARLHPLARHTVPQLLAQLQGDTDDRDWARKLYAYFRDTFETDPPATRPAGGTVFEYVLVELEAQGKLNYLFDTVEASKHFELHRLLVRLALATRFASHPRVVASYRTLNERHNEGWEHTYFVKEKKIWLRHDSDREVRVNGIVAEADSIYSAKQDQKRFKEASLPKLRVATEAEAQELLKRILLGQDKRQYTDEEFGQAALANAINNAKKYNLSDNDIETVTVERSVRLLDIEMRVEGALENIYVTYDMVERTEGQSWQQAEPVPNSRRTKFIGGRAPGEGFEQLLWFQEYNKAAIVMQYFAIGVSALAVIAIAWEVGIVAGAVEIAGGGWAVGISIGISELFYAYRVIFKGEEFTWRGFFVAALDGYLAALTFRGAGFLGRGLAGQIGKESVTDAILGWIAEKLTVGVVGGATTGAVIRFSHDLINIATGTGGFSKASQYIDSMEEGAVFGIAVEFTVGLLGPLVRVSGRTALESGAEVIQAIREGRLSATRWMVAATDALENMRKALGNALETGSAENVIKAFRERLVRITQSISGEYRLALFRRVLELNPGTLTRESLEGLERLLTASRGELSNESVLALMNSLQTNQLRNLLEVLGTLDNAAVGNLARTNQFVPIITTDLKAARAALPGQEFALMQIAAKLRSQGLADQLQVIEGAVGQPRIIGLADWVAESAPREAERMLDKLMELAEARRLLQEHISDPSIVVRVKVSTPGAGKSSDITVERVNASGGTEVLRSTEVRTPDKPIERGRAFISGIAHAASKIPKGARTDPTLMPPGAQEGTIAVQWPPPPVRLAGDAELVVDTHGNYSRRSVADPKLSRGKPGNLLKDSLYDLNRLTYENPVEWVRRLTVINQEGKAIFEYINTTPGKIPTRWEVYDLQGGRTKIE